LHGNSGGLRFTFTVIQSESPLGIRTQCDTIIPQYNTMIHRQAGPADKLSVSSNNQYLSKLHSRPAITDRLYEREGSHLYSEPTDTQRSDKQQLLLLRQRQPGTTGIVVAIVIKFSLQKSVNKLAKILTPSELISST